MKNKIKCDFLIIGSGLAGLYAAHLASKYGTVSIITKHSLHTSSTYWAQGGIASAIDEDDSPEIHFEDTIKVGRGLCNKEAVKILVNEGPERINELISEGLRFDKSGKEFALGLEGGHSRRRILHLGGNETGKFIIEFLTDRIKKSNKINIYENFLVYKLITEDNKLYGCNAYSWNNKTDFTFVSNIVIIATGGGAGIYKRSTNPHSSIGDGITLAFNAGVSVVNMEFVQFHPTAFYSSTGDTFLISEAVRGEGGYLFDRNGKRFMKQIHVLAELAPRDVVSKGIFKVMNDQKVDNVFLSLTHLDKDKIRNRFKNIYETSLKYGINITEDLIPVAPAAHYLIGGINTGLNGETIIDGLYSTGETAYTGVHGANRLASNSLLECLVFSFRAVEDSKKCLHGNKKDKTWSEKYFINEQVNTRYLKLKKDFLEIMNSNVGIVRNKKSLKDALEFVNNIDSEWEYLDNEYYSDRLKSLKIVSGLIIKGALKREESRGCHLRTDFPDENKVLYNVHQSINEGISVKDI